MFLCFSLLHRALVEGCAELCIGLEKAGEKICLWIVWQRFCGTQRLWRTCKRAFGAETFPMPPLHAGFYSQQNLQNSLETLQTGKVESVLKSVLYKVSVCIFLFIWAAFSVSTSNFFKKNVTSISKFALICRYWAVTTIVLQITCVCTGNRLLGLFTILILCEHFSGSGSFILS